MEKPRIKPCDHFNPRHIKDFEKKVLQRQDIFCDSCFKKPPTSAEKDKEGAHVENLLMCLSCFFIGCNRQTSKQCMLQHGENKKHHVTYSLSLGAIWCYLCDYELKEYLLSTPKGEDPKTNAKLEKMEAYVKDVDACFQKWIQKRRERQREAEEEGIQEERRPGKETSAVQFEVQVSKDSRSPF